MRRQCLIRCEFGYYGNGFDCVEHLSNGAPEVPQLVYGRPKFLRAGIQADNIKASMNMMFVGFPANECSISDGLANHRDESLEIALERLIKDLTMLDLATQIQCKRTPGGAKSWDDPILD